MHKKWTNFIWSNHPFERKQQKRKKNSSSNNNKCKNSEKQQHRLSLNGIANVSMQQYDCNLELESEQSAYKKMCILNANEPAVSSSFASIAVHVCQTGLIVWSELLCVCVFFSFAKIRVLSISRQRTRFYKASIGYSTIENTVIVSCTLCIGPVHFAWHSLANLIRNHTQWVIFTSKLT